MASQRPEQGLSRALQRSQMRKSNEQDLQLKHAKSREEARTYSVCKYGLAEFFFFSFLHSVFSLVFTFSEVSELSLIEFLTKPEVGRDGILSDAIYCRSCLLGICIIHTASSTILHMPSSTMVLLGSSF